MFRYTILGSSGDEAGADDYESAKLAACTLVRDGNARAEVYLTDAPYPIGHAQRAEVGEGVVYVGDTRKFQ